MYEVNLRIMLVGLSAEAAEAIQQVPARDRFTHGFALASRFSECPLQNGAFDVVIFTEEAMESLSISLICQGAGEKARCILVTDAPQKLKPEELKLLDEIWPAPLTAGLAAHYFDRFVQKLKDIKEAWLTKVYWQTTINTSPDLIWYKDKVGAHLEVNDAFCAKCKTDPRSFKGNLLSALMADLIYTPIITVIMTVIMVGNARKHTPEAVLAAGQGPSVAKSLPLSLIVGLVAGFLVAALVQPVLMKALLKKNGLLGGPGAGGPGAGKPGAGGPGAGKPGAGGPKPEG